VWNDFDDTGYRDHCFTYPTEQGPIATIQWEGFREAVDDMRHLRTLEEAVETAHDSDDARRAREWIGQIDPAGDLYDLRAEMVGWIERLK